MATLNHVALIGNLTRDPDLRYTPKGSAVCDLGIAVNRTYKAESGEKQQETTFIDIVVWAQLAEIVANALSKGSQIFVEGRLQMDTWDDKETGQKRTKIRVVADNVQFLDRKQADDGEQQQQPRQTQAPRQQSAPQQRPPTRPAQQRVQPVMTGVSGGRAPARDFDTSGLDDDSSIPF